MDIEKEPAGANLENLGDSRHPGQRKQLCKGPEAGMSSGGSKRRMTGKEAEQKVGTLGVVVGTGLSPWRCGMQQGVT